MTDVPRVTPAAGFDRLAPEHRAELAALVEAAAVRRAEALGRAIEESLRHIPALLRGPVRKTLGL